MVSAGLLIFHEHTEHHTAGQHVGFGNSQSAVPGPLNRRHVLASLCMIHCKCTTKAQILHVPLQLVGTLHSLARQQIGTLHSWASFLRRRGSGGLSKYQQPLWLC
jgi:hypothetical protein